MKRSLIMAAGAQALASGGIAELDLARIAAESGLKPSSLRYYFKNKEDLAEALYHDRLSEMDASLSRAEREPTFEGLVRKLFEIEVENYAQYLAGRASRKAQLGEVRTLEKARRQRIGERFLHVLQRASALTHERGGATSPGMDLLAGQLLLENLFWIPAWIDHFRRWEFPRVVDDLSALFCRGAARADVAPDWRVIEEESPSPEADRPRDDPFLRTASQLICQRGYRGTSIDAIAAALGVTKGSFYHHNSEKEALVERCFEAGYDRVSRFQRNASERFDQPFDRIASVLASIVAVQMDQTAPIMRSSALPGLPRELRVATIAAADPLDRWYVGELARAHARGEATAVDPFVAAQFMTIGANVSYDLARLYRYPASDDNVAEIVARLLHGFAN